MSYDCRASIQWISPANWAFRALAQLCLTGLQFRCTTLGPSTICIVSGEDALEMFGVNYPGEFFEELKLCKPKC